MDEPLSEGPSAAMGLALPEDVHTLFLSFLVCGCERTARHFWCLLLTGRGWSRTPDVWSSEA